MAAVRRYTIFARKASSDSLIIFPIKVVLFLWQKYFYSTCKKSLSSSFIQIIRNIISFQDIILVAQFLNEIHVGHATRIIVCFVASYTIAM